jgi:hypothetical protein
MAHRPADGDSLTVYKRDHHGREVWQYPAQVLERGPHCVRLEAFFNRDDIELGFAVFKRGDRFIETFYTDRWYNVFAVYDREDGALKGWYCNVCRPAQISTSAVHCDDLALDVWIDRDGATRTMDEEEFDALPLSALERAQGEAAVAILLELAGTNRLPR